MSRPRTNKTRVPKLCRHKGTGQAVVRLGGRDHYCGRWGTVAAQTAYDRLIERWLANGRSLPEEFADTPLSIEEVLAAYLDHAETHHRGPDGKPTTELACIKLAMRPLRRLYADVHAADFGPRSLMELREAMCRQTTRFGKPPARHTVNGYIRRVKAIFKWAVTRELIPPSVYEGLRAVDGLRAGRSGARETPPIRPVTREQVDETLPKLSRQVAALVELMWLTGMRVGEVVAMRMSDINRSSTIWEYRPRGHKMAHLGRERVVPLGPKAKKVLALFLKADPETPLFSPAEAEQERHEARRQAAVAPLTPERVARRRAEERTRALGDAYTTDAVRRAITRACEDAEIDHWHPHQLRHAAGTRFRAEAGLEAARVLLGHSSPVVTEQHYAEVDRIRAQELMAKLG